MQTVLLFEDKLRIRMPEDFYLIPESEAADIYPFRERPQVIFATIGYSRFLTFSLLKKLLAAEETLNAAREMRKLIWSLYPNSILSKAVLSRFGNLKCSSFSFRTGLKQSQIFNSMFAVSFEERLLLATFGCGIDDDEGKTLLGKLISEAEYIGG